MLTDVTTTFDLSDYFGQDFDARRTKAWATTNAPDQTIHDESTGETRIGAAYATIADDGTGSFTHWAPGADANPATWQTTYHFDVPDRSQSKGRRVITLGPFTVTASGELTALVEEQVATPTAVASDYADAAGASATAAGIDAESALASSQSAAASATVASTAAEAAVDISGISTSDGVVTALIDDGASATSTALSATYARTVMLPAASGGDDLAAMQAILTDNPGAYIRGVPGETYSISANLTIGSGQTLDMTGCTITARTGNRTGLLKNAALAGAGARDTNITVTGGTWDKNGQTYNESGAGGRFNGTGVGFHRCDHLTIRDGIYADQGAATKYAVGVGDVTNFRLTRLHFDGTNSDGVHVLGPASNGVIDNLTGETHDDMVSLTARDYEDWTTGGGDITNVTVEKVYPAGSVAAVKVLAGSGATCKGITVRTVKGTTTNAGVYVVDDNFDADTTGGTWDAIVIEDIDLVTGAAYAAVRVGGSAGDIKTVTIRDVTAPAAASRAVSLGNGGTNATLGHITIDGIRATALHTDRLIAIEDGTPINTLVIQNTRALLKTDKSAGQVLVQGTGSTITNLHILDVTVTNGAGGFTLGGTVTRTYADRSTFDCTASFTCSANAHTIKVGHCTQVNGNFVNLSGTGSLILLGGVVQLLNSSVTVSKTASQTFRINGVGLTQDLTKVNSYAQHDIAFNNNGAMGQGTGLCVVSGGGGVWKNLYTGATN